MISHIHRHQQVSIMKQKITSGKQERGHITFFPSPQTQRIFLPQRIRVKTKPSFLSILASPANGKIHRGK